MFIYIYMHNILWTYFQDAEKRLLPCTNNCPTNCSWCRLFEWMFVDVLQKWLVWPPQTLQKVYSLHICIYIIIYIYIHTWNPNVPCFDRTRHCFGGKTKDRRVPGIYILWGPVAERCILSKVWSPVFGTSSPRHSDTPAVNNWTERAEPCRQQRRMLLLQMHRQRRTAWVPWRQSGRLWNGNCGKRLERWRIRTIIVQSWHDVKISRHIEFYLHIIWNTWEKTGKEKEGASWKQPGRLSTEDLTWLLARQVTLSNAR